MWILVHLFAYFWLSELKSKQKSSLTYLYFCNFWLLKGVYPGYTLGSPHKVGATVRHTHSNSKKGHTMGTLTRGIGGKVWIKHMLDLFVGHFYSCHILENGSHFDKCFENNFSQCSLLIFGLAGAGSQHCGTPQY